MTRMHLLEEQIQEQSQVKIHSTVEATDNVENKVGEIITPIYNDINSPYNQTPRWSDNCVTDLNGTVYMDNGRWDMIPCPNC